MCVCYVSFLVPPSLLYLGSLFFPSVRACNSFLYICDGTGTPHTAPPFTRLFSSLYYSFTRLRLLFFLLGPLCDLLSCVGVLPMNLAEHPVVCFGNQILLGTFHNPLFLVLSYDELLSQLIFPSFSLKHLPSFFPCDNEGKQEVKGGGTEGNRMSCITVHPEVWHWHNILF